MPIFYLCYIYSFFLFSYDREKNIQKLLFPLLIAFIIVFSIRSSPDEYMRYLEIAVPENFLDLGYGLFSQWLFNLICQICKFFPNPLTLLYLISYSLIFFLIHKSIQLISDKSYSISFFTIGFYLSHAFLSFYEGIRGSLANILVLFAICIFIKYKRIITTIIYLYLAASIHIQTLPFLFIFATYTLSKEIFKRIKLFKFKQKKVLIVLSLILIFASSITFRSSISKIFINFVFSNASFFAGYDGYLYDKSYVYEINILGFTYLGLLCTNLVILVLSYQPIFSHPNKRHRILFFLVLFGQVLSLAFSNLALVAYRFSSAFLYFQMPLIASLITIENKNKISYKKFILILLASALSFWNIFIQENLKSFAF